MICYKCGEPGHAKSQCPSTPSQIDTMEKPGGCFICGGAGHSAAACRLNPARLRRIQGAACGPGPCSQACRSGDHPDCGPAWCSCLCHAILQAVIR